MKNVKHCDLSKFIEKHYPRYQIHELFQWLLDDVIADLTQSKKKNPPPAEAIPVIRDLAGLYAQAVTCADPFDDILGNVYQELASHGAKKWMGQYFTPMPVARMMAKFNLMGERPNSRLIKVLEPACGSGVLLMAICQEVIERYGKADLVNWSLTGIDLDRYCASMTAAQLLANTYIHQVSIGEIVVYRGNAFNPESCDVLLHAVSKHVELPLPLAKAPERIEVIREALVMPKKQMGLF
ncbi:MAG: SAM-dependent methyltransferase [Gammaproteobacteria bacterium]|nr:SAM-dependent methyltransferase [Gammaproteobacteria bacterium]